MNSSPKVAIVVDSAASLPSEATDHPLVQVVPMHLEIDEVSYLDGKDISPTEFYQLQKTAKRVPTTSAPSPSSYVEAFRQAAQTSQSVLCITVGSKFSASCDAAILAVDEMRTTHPRLEIEVIDSENAAGGEGLIALQAWRISKTGAPLHEVSDAARAVAKSVGLIAYVDTLHYLWKGGRVPRIAKTGAAILQIKPIFELSAGNIKTVAKPRTRRKAAHRLVELMRERVHERQVTATVMHADVPGAAEALFQRISSTLNCKELFTTEFTPVMGAHIGPGLLGIAFWVSDSEGS